MVRLSSCESDLQGVELYAKAEWKNPGGSVKDLAAARMSADPSWLRVSRVAFAGIVVTSSSARMATAPS